jgi:hypothetical protein
MLQNLLRNPYMSAVDKGNVKFTLEQATKAQKGVEV